MYQSALIDSLLPLSGNLTSILNQQRSKQTLQQVWLLLAVLSAEASGDQSSVSATMARTAIGNIKASTADAGLGLGLECTALTLPMDSW